MDGGSNPGVLVERPQPDPDDRRIVRVAAEQRRAAVSAEPLFGSTLGLPGTHLVLSLEDLERAGLDPSVRRGTGAGATLAPGAVAVLRRDERRGHLEAD